MIWPWAPKPKILPLSDDDLDLWESYHKADRWKAAQLKKDRELHRHLWLDVNLPHAVAIWNWRRVPIRFCAGMDENEGVS